MCGHTYHGNPELSGKEEAKLVVVDDLESERVSRDTESQTT